jgi:hypothetical protein
MQISGSHISCGIYAMHNLHISHFKQFLERSEEEAVRLGVQLYGVGEGWKTPRQGFRPGYKYIFSDVVGGQGTTIASFIRNNDLGDLKDIGEHQNPNTFNRINMWIWTYNGKKLPKPAVKPVSPTVKVSNL